MYVYSEKYNFAIHCLSIHIIEAYINRVTRETAASCLLALVRSSGSSHLVGSGSSGIEEKLVAISGSEG